MERTIRGVDPSRDELLPYVGPAAALPLFGALARLPQPLAVRVWSGLLAGALCALVLAALALARSRRVAALLGGLALALVSGPAVSDLALGQVALVAAAGIGWALVAFERGSLAGGALATLLAGSQPNLALALIARMRDRTALLAAGLGGLAFAALTLAAGGGLRGFGAYVHRLREHGRAEQFVTIQHTPAAIAWAFGAPAGAPAGAAGTIGTAVALLALAALAVVTVRARLGRRDGALLALAGLPLAVPFFHEHDFVLELIPVLVLALRAEGAARAWAGAGAVLVLVDWLGLAQRPAADAQYVALGLAVAGTFVALGSGARARRADLAPLLALAALALVAVPLARAHPAPTWPDALPAAYRAPAGADASAVWAGEQHAAGLDAREPAWGFLRAFPLVGCAALGVALVLNRRWADSA